MDPRVVGHDRARILNSLFELQGAVGLVAALARSGAFVAASPLFGRMIPVTGRIALSLALGVAMAEPLATDPTTTAMIGLIVVNAALGLALGYLTGLLVPIFEFAGSVIDFTSGLSASQIFDPLTRTPSGVFSRSLNLVAITLLFLSGGDRLLIAALHVTTLAVPLDGGIAFEGAAAQLAIDMLARMVEVAIQIALPALGILFLIEFLLGLASRLAPQANVFIIGLPAKALAAMAAVCVVLVSFPDAVNEVMRSFEEAVKALVGGPI